MAHTDENEALVEIAERVQVELERRWHEHVCACLSWSAASTAPHRGCVSTMNAPDFWTVEQVLEVHAELTSPPASTPEEGQR